MLLLDSEAISCIAHGPRERRDRVRALIAVARRGNRSVGTVAAVLAEVVRGHPRDAAVFGGLRRERVEVHRVDTRVAVRAGQLLERSDLSSADAIDAFVVAVADLLGGAVIATVDPADLGRLAAHGTGVVVADIRRGRA
jgi:predicted nucleic acid-binding protein